MEKNTKQFAIRLPASLWREIQKQAEAELVTPSNYIRRLLIKSIEHEGHEEEHEEEHDERTN